MANNIRSEYLQQLLNDKNMLEEQLKNVTKSTIQSIINEKIEKNFKKIILESGDEFIEDEIEDTETVDSSSDVNASPKSSEGDETSDVTAEISDETQDVIGDESGEGETEIVDTDFENNEEGSSEEEDVWGEVEQFKGDDGEYDLTGMDMGNLLKVMKVMSPEDGIRVVKNDNGTITINDEETNKEYIVDINSECTDESCGSESTDTDTDDNMNESELGYTDNFQNKTAMTTPSNKEPANPKTTYSMDGGAPTGDGKRWANQGDKAPYNEEVNEEFEIELDEDEINETMTTQEQGPYNRNTGMVHTNTNSKAAKGRNAHAGGQQISGTGDNSYSNAQNENINNIKRKANAIFLENKELKKLIPVMRQKIMEAIVINKSMGNVIRILTENSTSTQEKKDILSRFKSVKTIEESDNLYGTISEELTREGRKLNNLNEKINSQLSESKVQNIVETPMYQVEDMSKVLSLMNRVNKIK